MATKTTSLLAVSGAEVLDLVDPARLVDALAEGFKALSAGIVQAPPRPKVDVPGKGFSLAMLAWTPGQNLSLKTVNVFHGNHAHGLESHQALVSLFDPDTGAPLAILDGASLTGLRTAAAAILSVRCLARADARVATVVGAGVQGREHVRQLSIARPFSEIRVFARNPDTARSLAASVPNAVAITDLEAAVATSDVVCLTTSSDVAVIEAGWLRPGTHVTSVGFTPPGSELPLDLLDTASLFVETMAAFEPAPVGCAELAGRDKASGAELGQVLSGDKPGRVSETEITLYKSMGNAMQDMVAANLAYAAALAADKGQRIEL